MRNHDPSERPGLRNRAHWKKSRAPGAARLGLALLALAVFGSMTQARRKPKKLGPPADFPGHVDYLLRQLYGIPLDQSDLVTSEIQKLVVGHLDGWIENRAPTAVEVRRELESVFSKTHYPFMGQPAVMEAPWKDRHLIVAGYTVGWSDVDRASTVVLYESRDGHTHQAAVTNFVPRTDLHYDLLPPGDKGNFRFMVWGTRLGKSQPRLTAILYDFDGQSLRPLWKDEDAYDGKIEVSGSEVIIRYLKENEYIHAVEGNRLPPRYEATYRLTGEGLKLQNIRDIPF